MGKKTAIDVGTKLVKKDSKINTKILQKHVSSVLVSSAPYRVATKVQNILNKYVNKGSQNINSLIDGSGNNAITIQDLIRKLNGSGLKIVLKLFSMSKK